MERRYRQAAALAERAAMAVAAAQAQQAEARNWPWLKNAWRAPPCARRSTAWSSTAT
ncbi:hypothetical protein LP419_39815 [Massilia sp. H-1]|nr:hypothetical protein LP419_39815 [Massilia sp. H-1]